MSFLKENFTIYLFIHANSRSIIDSTTTIVETFKWSDINESSSLV